MRVHYGLGLAICCFIGCSPGGASSSGPRGSSEALEPGGDGNTPGGVFGEEDCEPGECIDLVGQSALAACGDGLLSDDEACDDSNNEDGDGCSSDCLVVDPGFSCNPPGQLCRPIARCGDGNLGATELCDDGNSEAGDGCSSTCKLEIGFKCDGEPSLCTPTTCGDGVQEGAESCDDGNAQPFDGCSSTCQKEPACADGPCSSECGDGLVIGEECDDGNQINGDGCSSDCVIEPGFECSEDAQCEEIGGGCVLRVPAIFRDFAATHSDFAVACDAEVTGIPLEELGPGGTPELASGAGACIAGPESFAEWYSDGPNRATVVGDIVLFENDTGGFVNRWGPEGEPWQALENALWAADTVEACAPDCVPCPWDANVGCTADVVSYDGNPLFFPLDSHPDALAGERNEAKIPAQYGYPSWPWESTVVPDAGLHNFYFTSEVRYWFRYDPAEAATLDFIGDDDVWVFVNGHLAVDLGGVHVPLPGQVTLDAAAGAAYGMEDGGVYEIAVFHAERKMEGSSFQLTLEGFNTARSECLPFCGDGIVGLGEECDDAENDGGYGECGEGCVLDEFCGDGIVQEEFEDCDDGNNREGDECGSACRIIEVR